MSFHQFRGQKTAKPQASGGFSQAKTRHTVHSFDQDGRKFWFPAENATGMPCGTINPCFESPFEIDTQYIVINPENTSECYVDHIACVRDRVRAMRQYHKRAVEASQKKNLPAPTLGVYPDDVIAAHPDGVPPRAFQLALACEKGNPWALGHHRDRQGHWGPKDETHRIKAVPDPRLEMYVESPSRDDIDSLDAFDFGAKSYDAIVAGIASSAQGTAAAANRAAFTARRTRPGAGAGDDLLEKIQEDLEQEELEQNEATSEFDELAGAGDGTGEDADGGEFQIDGMDELPNAWNGADVDQANVDDDLVDTQRESLEATHDPEALGGRTVRPENSDRAARQAPRSPAATSVPRKRANNPPKVAANAGDGEAVPRRQGERRKWNPENKKSLADGALPVVGDQ